MKNNEATQQKLFINWCKSKGLFAWGVQNENPFSKFVNKEVVFKLEREAKAMGKYKGLSDCTVMLQDRILFIEFKYGRGKQSKEQIAFGNNVNKYDYAEYYVAYSCEEAISIVKDNM